MKYLPLAALALAACVQSGHADETVLAPDFTKMDWMLMEVDGLRVDYTATLNLGDPGRITGQAPCNRYFAGLTRKGDSFTLGTIGATKMACLQIAGEDDFFKALQGVETASQGPGTLTLSGGGHDMIFVQPID